MYLNKSCYLSSYGKTLNLIVDEAPINLDVTISTLSYEAVGAYGDIEYTIELEEASVPIDPEYHSSYISGHLI